MDKLDKFNFIGVRNLTNRFRKNLSWLFFLVFLVMLVMDVLRIKNSAAVILNMNQEPAVLSKDKGVRINFDKYHQVVKKIQTGQAYEPAGMATSSPFGVKK